MALSVLGALLLAIAIQLTRRMLVSDSIVGEDVVVSLEPLDLSENLLAADEARVSASSHNVERQKVDSLRDVRRTSYWHVALDRVGREAWVLVDFGPDRKKTVRRLMALPRMDIPRQFFRHARLLGSPNGETWELVSEITEPTRPAIATWREWRFENDRAYRFYKFVIFDGYESGKFLSLAELALFE